MCRHGDALAREIDHDRPLGEHGSADIRNTADVLRGRLLLGNGERRTLAFQPGAVAALGRDEAGAWLIEWMLTPELVSESPRS